MLLLRAGLGTRYTAPVDLQPASVGQPRTA
jgi:hypothetical protein